MSWHPLDNEKPLPEEDQVTNQDLIMILRGEVLPQNLRSQKLEDIRMREYNRQWHSILRDPAAYFKTLSTRHLIHMFREAQRWQSGFYVERFMELPRDYTVNGRTTEQALRSEIASRPRIPPKKQSATIRRDVLKAKNHEHRSDKTVFRPGTGIFRPVTTFDSQGTI